MSPLKITTSLPRSLYGPVDVQVAIAAKFRAMWVAAFGCGQDNSNGLVDIAKAFDYLTRRTEGGLPMGNGMRP
jgi:hypothetical protein